MAAAGKAKGKTKTKCLPLPKGWDIKMSGPAYSGPSFRQQGEDIAKGNFKLVTEIGFNPQTGQLDVRPWKIHHAVPEARALWYGWLGQIKRHVEPMPSQSHSSHPLK